MIGVSFTPCPDEKGTESENLSKTTCRELEVSLHAAMKSGLKDNPISLTLETNNVALHAAMKSGLKAVEIALNVSPVIGCTPCRDEKRTERGS